MAACVGVFHIPYQLLSTAYCLLPICLFQENFVKTFSTFSRIALQYREEGSAANPA